MLEQGVERTPSRDGTRIDYTRSGQGPPLVLVHGTTADRTRWAPLLPAFEEHFKVYAVDRRGRAESGDAKEYTIEREFDDVAAVVDSLPEPANLLGHSYGALCSLEAALRTHNLHKVVLYEPPPPPPGPPPEWMAKRPAGISAFMATLLRYRLDVDHLRSFDRPVYYSYGSLSNPEWQAMRDRLAALFPDFTAELYEGASHLNTSHQREPARVAAALRRLWERAKSRLPERMASQRG